MQLPDTLPVIGIVNTYVCYPFSVTHYLIDTKPGLIDDFLASGDRAVFVPITTPGCEEPLANDIFSFGTLMAVSDIERKADGTIRVEGSGLARVHITDVVQERPYLRARVALTPDIEGEDPSSAVCVHSVIDAVRKLYAIIWRDVGRETQERFERSLSSLQETDEVVYVLSSILQSSAVSNWAEIKGYLPIQRDISLFLDLLAVDPLQKKLELLEGYATAELNRQTAPQALRSITPAPHPPPRTNTVGVVLGEECDATTGRLTGREVALGDVERQSGLNVPGNTGMGKSTFLINVFLQDILRGHGGVFIEPEGSAITEILSRIPDADVPRVVLVEPSDTAYPIGLNPVACRNIQDARERDKTASLLLHVFKKIWGPGTKEASWGPQLENVLRNCIYTLMYNQLTLAEMPLVLRDTAFRQRMISMLPKTKDWYWVRWFWENDFENLADRLQIEHTESTLNKVLAFLTTGTVENIVGQLRTTIDFSALMRDKKIVLVRLATHGEHGIGEDAVKLLGTMLLSELAAATFSRPKQSRHFFSIVCDEFELFAAGEFKALLTRGRQFGIGCVVAYQTLTQLEDLRADTLQMGNTVCYKIGPDDAPTLASLFVAPPVKPETPITIPRNVLPFMDRHSHPAVKALWRRYIDPLNLALAKHERQESDSYFDSSGSIVHTSETIWPNWDFGSGVVVTYEPDNVRKARIALNDVLYETQHTGSITEQLRRKALDRMGILLDYSDYACFLYQSSLYRENRDIFTAPVYRKEIDEDEQVRDLLASYLTTQNNLLHFWHYNSYSLGYLEDKKLFFEGDYHHRRNRTSLPHELQQLQQKDLADAQKWLSKRAAEHHEPSDRYQSLNSYLRYLMPFYQQAFEKKYAGKRHELTEKITEDRKWNFSKYENHYYKPWWEKIEDLFQTPVSKLVERMLPNEEIVLSDTYENKGCRFGIKCTVTEALTGLADVEHFLILLAEKTSLSDKGWGENGWGLEPIQRPPRGQPFVYQEQKPLYGGKTPETVRQRLTEECAKEYAFHNARNTVKKLLDLTRAFIEKEIAEIELRLQPLYRKRDIEVEKRQEKLDKQKAREKRLHDDFAAVLDAALEVLMLPEHTIKEIPVESDRRPPREESETDMRMAMERQLRDLEPYSAYCRIMDLQSNDGKVKKCKLAPFPLAPSLTQTQALFDARMNRIQNATRSAYCTARDEVEKAILSRRVLRRQAVLTRAQPGEETVPENTKEDLQDEPSRRRRG